jgi:hypothetical protein
LDVDDVEAEFVLLDNAVDAAVADPAERATHFRASAAVAHPNQEVDDEALEEGGTQGMHPLDDLPRELGVEDLETRSDQFLRTFAHLGFIGGLSALALGFPGDEFRVSLEQAEVDLAHALREQLPAAVGGAAIPAPRQFDEPRL